MGGLDKFDRKREKFTHYTTTNGLPSDTPYGILEDEQGRLWLSTTNGLSRFDPGQKALETIMWVTGFKVIHF
jgi:ligand-binding sensor domain-containing protein